MNIIKVPLQLLIDSAQPRDLVPANVEMLRASIEQVGLIQPIRVRPAGVIVRGLGESGYQVIAGHHRVAACKALGWTQIDAIVDTAEHLQAELMEIDENLCRAELTASQRAQAIKRRRQIWEALHPGEAPCGKTLSTRSEGGQFAEGHEMPKGFAASTAAAAGMTKQAINQHLARADALGEDLERIAGTSLDKGVELDALKALPEPERKELIERAAAGEKVSARVSQKNDTQPMHELLLKTINDSVDRILCVANADSISEFAELVKAMPDRERKPIEDALVALELIGNLCEDLAEV